MAAGSNRYSRHCGRYPDKRHQGYSATIGWTDDNGAAIYALRSEISGSTPNFTYNGESLNARGVAAVDAYDGGSSPLVSWRETTGEVVARLRSEITGTTPSFTDPVTNAAVSAAGVTAIDLYDATIGA